MTVEGTVFLNREINRFHTAISTGQYSTIDPADPFYDQVYHYLRELKPAFFRSHNHYNDDYADSTGLDDFQIVEPYPPEHDAYQWNFGQLDQKILAELENCDRDTYVYNIRTCPVWMLDKTKPAPLFPHSSGEVRDKTYRQLADFCTRIVGWYNRGGFIDEKGVFQQSGHFLNIKYWEILNEQDEAESAIYIKTGREYAQAYDAIVRAIKKADPGVLCGGPSQSCVPTEKHDLTYIREFLEYAEEKVDFLTIHYYSDQSGLLSPAGMKRLNQDLKDKPYERQYLESIDDIGQYFRECVKLAEQFGAIPVFVSETNVCLDDRFDQPLAWGEFSQGNFGAAWLGYLFKIASLSGIGRLQQYQFYSPLNRSRHLKNYLSLINNRTGEPHLTYRLIKALNGLFPEGGVMVENDFAGDIEILAVKYPDRKRVVLLAVNKAISERTADRFIGEERQVDIRIDGCEIIEDSAKLLIFDRLNSGVEQAPDFNRSSAGGNRFRLTLQGYGAALLDLEMV